MWRNMVDVVHLSTVSTVTLRVHLSTVSTVTLRVHLSTVSTITLGKLTGLGLTGFRGWGTDHLMFESVIVESGSHGREFDR